MEIMNMVDSRRKGFQFERDVVNAARRAGLPAERCWSSDGRTKGLPSEVDVIIDGEWYQCKRVKRIAGHLLPDNKVFGQIIRQDRDEAHVVIRLSDFLNMLKEVTQ
jgi:hypothetical protein